MPATFTGTTAARNSPGRRAAAPHRRNRTAKEPALASVQANDLLLDAGLVLDLLAAGVRGHAFDGFFRTIRGSDETPQVEAWLSPTAGKGCVTRSAKSGADRGGPTA